MLEPKMQQRDSQSERKTYGERDTERGWGEEALLREYRALLRECRALLRGYWATS